MKVSVNPHTGEGKNMFLYQIWEFCKAYPGWAAVFFFCGYLIGAVIKNSMHIV